MKKSMITITALALMLLLPGILLAGRGRMPGEMGKVGLELDDKQLDELGKLRLEHRIGNIELVAEQRKLRLKMRMELLKSEPSRKELERFAGEIGIVRGKIQKNRIDHLLKVREILDDDQWKRFIRRHRGVLRGCKPPTRCIDSHRRKIHGYMHKGCIGEGKGII